jgi:hypothetical protein
MNSALSVQSGRGGGASSALPRVVAGGGGVAIEWTSGSGSADGLSSDRSLNFIADTTKQRWTRIREALADQKWDFRTVQGIAKETGIPASDVEQMLKLHASHIRIAVVPDESGHLLYTDATRPMKLREWLASVRAFVAKSPY